MQNLIPEFDGRMDVDDFLDWLNMVEHVFEYYCLPKQKNKKKSEVGGYKDVQQCFDLVEKHENVKDRVKRRLKLWEKWRAEKEVPSYKL